MLDVDKKIIELILTLGGQASRTQLLRTGGLSLEALYSDLRRLEQNGVVGRTTDGDHYLRGVSTR
jgi:DNA-binding HxlR family transcriptional regulator